MDELAQLTGGRFAYRTGYISEYDQWVKDAPLEWMEQENQEDYALPVKKGGLMPEQVLPDVRVKLSLWTWKEILGVAMMVLVMVRVYRAK